MSSNLNLRLALLDRRPVFFVNSTTKRPEGLLSKYFYRWGLVLYEGFNVTWESGGQDLGGCNNGTCTQLARFIQLNGSDCDQLHAGMFLYDSIYPNLTLSPPIDEKGCFFITYYRNPLTEFSLDCLITLTTIQPSVIILLIGLAIFVKLTPLIVVLTSRNQKQYNKASKVNIKGTIKDTKITITKVSEMIIGTNDSHLTSPTAAIQLMRVTLTVVLTLLQIWYSVNFQTDLTLTSSESPVTSLSDLIDRNLTLQTIKIGSCHRSIEQLGEAKILAHVRAHYSTITFGKTIKNAQMFVYLAGKWEIEKAKKDMEVFDKESEHLGKYFEYSAPFGSSLSVNLINTQMSQALYDKLVNRIYQHVETQIARHFHDKNGIRPTHLYRQTTSIDNSIYTKIDYNKLTIVHYSYYFPTLIIAIFPVCSIILICEIFAFQITKSQH